MNHTASIFSNGKTITIAKGDTLTVVLHYVPVRTAWSFGDDLAYQAALSLGEMQVGNGVRTMQFSAHSAGQVEINLTESFVLGFPGASGINATYKLTVIVL
jgi:hypothetical protein